MNDRREDFAILIHDCLRKHRVVAPDLPWFECGAEYRQRMTLAAKEIRDLFTTDPDGTTLEERLRDAWQRGYERGQEMAFSDLANSSGKSYRSGYLEGYAFGARRWGGISQA
jgi:hypothetical protein